MASDAGRPPLLWPAAALAVVTGALHVFFAFDYFANEAAMQVMFVGMGAVYFAGTALALIGWKLDLVLKGAAVFVVLLLVTWAGGASYGRAVNLQPLSLVDKVVEAALLVLLILLIRGRKATAPAGDSPAPDGS